MTITWLESTYHSDSDNSTLTESSRSSLSDDSDTYQEITGAPVEWESPLGTHVGWVTVAALNIGRMMGTGIFSTPASVLCGAGSTGLSLIMWMIGYITATSGTNVLMEYASCFPHRSGSAAVYLEQAYPRPRYLFPATFALQTVAFAFSSNNVIVLAEYLFKMMEAEPTEWEVKAVAVLCYTVAVLLLVFSTRFSLWLANAITFVKVLFLMFISLTGFCVLAGFTRVRDPGVNFRRPFEGTNSAPYEVTNALLKVVFAFSGFENAFNVVNEIKNPVKTLRKSVPVSITIVSILFVTVNIAFFAAGMNLYSLLLLTVVSLTKHDIVPNKELKESKEVAASLFFDAVFGEGQATQVLNFLVVICAFGSLISVLIGSSRLIRECGRQGVLPYAWFWTSTKPFGTPLGPYFVRWFMTVLLIILPPAGDAFNFVTDLAIYPSSVFNFFLAIGIFLLRARRKKLGMPRASYRAWDAMAIFFAVVNVYLLVMPWYPPPGGRYGGDVSFWYATYVVVGIGFLLSCASYWYIFMRMLPRWNGYRIRQEILILDDGAVTNHLVKIPVAEVPKWDREHDAAGNVIKPQLPFEYHDDTSTNSYTDSDFPSNAPTIERASSSRRNEHEPLLSKRSVPRYDA